MLSSSKKIIYFFLTLAITAALACAPASLTPPPEEQPAELLPLYTGELDVSGDCDDPNGSVTLDQDNNGDFSLADLDGNPIIPLLISGNTLTASGVIQFGQGNHNLLITMIDPITLAMSASSPTGSCNSDLVIAAQGSRCLYDVVSATCSNELLPGDRVCLPCKTPCKDFGGKKCGVLVQGTPVVECTVELSAPITTNCGSCGGKKGLAIKSGDACQ